MTETTLPTLMRARAFVVRNGHILLMHRIKNGFEYYTLLGGRGEPGETPDQTCVREVFEESGVQVRVETLLHREEDVFEGSLNIHYIYECIWLSGEPALGGEEVDRNSPENSYEPLWVPLEKVKDLVFCPPWMGDTIKTCLNL